MATKLHELIAAEPSVAAVFNQMKEETFKTFGKPDMFIKKVTTKRHFSEDDQRLDTEEVKEATTTVLERLRYTLEKSFSNYLDIEAQMDSTNTVAKADLVVGDQTLLKDVPAATLLQFEKDFKAIRDMVLAAPTLAPGKEWIPDPQTEGLFKAASPDVTFATRKTMRPVILYPATDKHPAQVEKVNEDIPVAKVETMTWSGMMTSKQKAEMLARIDALVVAAKKARQRANSTEVKKVKVGRTITNFILNGPEEVSETTDE